MVAAAIIIGYLLGSIPTAYIFGRLFRRVDIRRVGGGNMGALNSARELGPVWGLLVLLIDIAKGAGAILIAGLLGVGQVWVFLAGFAAIAGHCWPVFLKFRGGKGAAVTIGVFFALAPREYACALPLLLITVLLTSNITLGMAVSLIFFPLFLWIFGNPWSLIIYALLIALFLAARYAPTAVRGIRKSAGARDFLIEKNYKPWQSRRPKPHP
jgi:acyl phosphate:glycerol-3-phosphate acyltransferase